MSFLLPYCRWGKRSSATAKDGEGIHTGARLQASLGAGDRSKLEKIRGS
jgi:hypothetical protein